MKVTCSGSKYLLPSLDVINHLGKDGFWSLPGHFAGVM